MTSASRLGSGSALEAPFCGRRLGAAERWGTGCFLARVVSVPRQDVPSPSPSSHPPYSQTRNDILPAEGIAEAGLRCNGHRTLVCGHRTLVCAGLSCERVDGASPSSLYCNVRRALHDTKTKPAASLTVLCPPWRKLLGMLRRLWGARLTRCSGKEGEGSYPGSSRTHSGQTEGCPSLLRPPLPDGRPWPSPGGAGKATAVLGSLLALLRHQEDDLSPTAHHRAVPPTHPRAPCSPLERTPQKET